MNQVPTRKPRILSQKYSAVYARKWRAENPEACSMARCREPKLSGSLCEKHKQENYTKQRAASAHRKLRVLTHYGKGGKLQCCWRKCTVTDPDMLSLDHVHNDGAKARKESYEGCGSGLYRKVEREKYPKGFQTLCHNHQWKKEVLRRRGSAFVICELRIRSYIYNLSQQLQVRVHFPRKLETRTSCEND